MHFKPSSRPELEELCAFYAEAYQAADEVLRSRPMLLAALYARDALGLLCESVAGAAFAMMFLYFVVVMQDLSALQAILGDSVDPLAARNTAIDLFRLLFVLQAAVMLVLGRIGRSRARYVHAHAELLFTARLVERKVRPSQA